MGFVKRIFREIDHLIIDLIRRLLVDPVLHTSRHIRLFVPIDKDLALLLHDVAFFLGHGTAQKVAPPQRVPRKVAHDLHDLLLVHDTPVGRLQDRFQLRAVIGNGRRVILSLDILRDKIHGARTVQGDPGNDVLQAVGFQLLHEALHPRAFELEDAVRLPCADIVQHLCVIVINLLHINGGLFRPRHLHRVLDHSQRPEPQEIHL